MRKKIAECIRLVAVMAAVCVTAMFSCPCMAFAQSEIEDVQQLNQQVANLYQQGRYAEAIPIAQMVLFIYENSVGPEHPDTAIILNNLAELYRLIGDYANAKPLFERALKITEKVKGSNHPDTASILNNLASIYTLLGNYEKAESLYKRALKINENTVGVGPEHPATATSLNNLASLYMSLGDYAKAEPLLKRALQIREKFLGYKHLDTATTLSNLAVLYKSLGDYAKAEPLLKRALQIYEKSLGQEHLAMTPLLNNLARLYESLGDYAKAEPLYKIVLQIYINNQMVEHPNMANTLNNLAGLYLSLDDYTKAEPLYKTALQIYEKILGNEHPDTLLCLSNLAEFYSKIGDYEKAAPLHKSTLQIRKNTLGAEHPDTAASMNNLADFYHSVGDYANAEPLYKRASQILKNNLGTEHPSTATSLNNLGLLYANVDDFENSFVFQHKAQQADEKLIDQVMGFTSEDQKTKFIETKKGRLHIFFTLVSQHFADKASAKKDALDIWLKRKGIILESQKKMQETLIHSGNPEMQTVYQEYSSVRARLSKLIFSGPGREGLEAWQKNKADLEAKKQELDAKLSRLSQEFASRQKVLKADTDKIDKALPANTVLLEFARFGVYNFKAKDKENRWNPDHYLAFVLHAGRPDSVAMIDIGEAKKIDKAVELFKDSVPKKTERNIRDARVLYDLVFKPLRSALGSATEIFLSPDGNLNLIPFEALVAPDGKFLVEEYTFNYLAAGRDILAFGDSKEKGGKPLLMGDPDYDLEPAESAGTVQESETSEKTRSAGMSGFKFEKFPMLPGSREEVNAIASMMGKEKVFLYTDKEALEDVLMKTEAPRILHLATHGFFLQDQDLSSLRKDDRGTVIFMKSENPGMPDVFSRPIKYENPLLRSGIALAGANRASLGEGQTQGIVTAEKILGLNLRGTDLTVLSACETGLGDVQAGEGVYGLRRAFVQAGTRSLVMTLWSVTDTESKEFMTLFYQNLLSGKMSRIKAFRTAQLQQIENLRKCGKEYPFYWAAFVYLGEPGE